MENDIRQRENQNSQLELLTKITRLQKTREILATKLEAKWGFPFSSLQPTL